MDVQRYYPYYKRVKGTASCKGHYKSIRKVQKLEKFRRVLEGSLKKVLLTYCYYYMKGR